MNIQVFEEDIKTKLVTDIDAGLAEINVLPERQVQFIIPQDKGLINVCYKGSKWEKPQSSYEISQQEKAQVDIIIYARRLREAGGIYDLWNKVRLALIGFKPTDCDKLYAVSFDYIEYKENCWAFLMVMETGTTIVEAADEETGAIVQSSTGPVFVDGSVKQIKSDELNT